MRNERTKMKGRRREIKGIIFLAIIIFQISLVSCSPEAPWETEGVEVRMQQKTVSAGFVEYDFSTNKDAYYLIAICEPWEDYNPVANPKQFMQLALDSAYAEYLLWRNDLLRAKEFNVAPFASHSLQYGQITHFFTGLIPDHDYWVYAFPVNPETMQPVGKLGGQPRPALSKSASTTASKACGTISILPTRTAMSTPAFLTSLSPRTALLYRKIRLRKATLISISYSGKHRCFSIRISPMSITA